MINKKGKRKLEFQGKSYYWHIKRDINGFPQIYIMSADKKLQLKDCFDKEIPIGPIYIKKILQRHFDSDAK